MTRRCPSTNVASAGFTLLEVLVALAAASLLMLSLTFAIQRLSQDWQRTDGRDGVGPLMAGVETTRRLLSQVQPLYGEDDLVLFEGDSEGLTARIQPPQALAAVGLLELKLTRTQTPEGVALVASMTPLGPYASPDGVLPAEALRDRILVQGLKDIRFAYIPAREPSEDPLSQWHPSGALPAVIVITFETGLRAGNVTLRIQPHATIDGRCLFDMVSGSCRL